MGMCQKKFRIRQQVCSQSHLKQTLWTQQPEEQSRRVNEQGGRVAALVRLFRIINSFVDSLLASVSSSSSSSSILLEFLRIARTRTTGHDLSSSCRREKIHGIR